MTVNDSMDVNHVDSTRPEEVDAALTRLWAHRGPLNGMYSPGHVNHAVGDFLPMMAPPGRELVLADWEEGA